MPIKRCIKCGEEKESKEFPKRKLSKDGFRNDCKKCYNKQKKEWAENNPEKRKNMAQYGKKFVKNNYDWSLISNKLDIIYKRIGSK